MDPQSTIMDDCPSFLCFLVKDKETSSKGEKQGYPKKHVLGEGKRGRKKYRRIPKCEGDWQGQVPKCSLPRELFKIRDFKLPNF